MLVNNYFLPTFGLGDLSTFSRPHFYQKWGRDLFFQFFIALIFHYIKLKKQKEMSTMDNFLLPRGFNLLD